ncbi:hypothetical protein AAU57_11465 [Nonlabens sp. YIK11]|nr:hypothetical protein AAU57_11465 [Nonlabens sp. YIK11]
MYSKVCRKLIETSLEDFYKVLIPKRFPCSRFGLAKVQINLKIYKVFETLVVDFEFAFAKADPL